MNSIGHQVALYGQIGGDCCVLLDGYRRVCILVGMTAIKVVRIFEVEI